MTLQVEDDLGHEHGARNHHEDRVVLEGNVVQQEVDQADEVEAHLEAVQAFPVIRVALVHIAEAVLHLPDVPEDSEGKDDGDEDEAEEEKKVVIEQTHILHSCEIK